MSAEISQNENFDKNLDKAFVKLICRCLYYSGLGDCWYENTERSTPVKLIYYLWCFISNFVLISVIISEVAANFRDDFTVMEKNDVFLHSMSHPMIVLKLSVLVLNRSTIKEFLKKLLEDTRCELTAKTEAESLKKCKIFITVFCAMLTALLFVTVFIGVQMYYKDGIPLRTLITYYPRNKDQGVFPTFCRIILPVIWSCLVVVMVSVDSLCVTSMIILSFKFRTLSLHFENLRTIINENRNQKTIKALEKDYIKSFVELIKLHQKILECSIYKKKALGLVCSFQVLQSIGVISGCLVQLAMSFHDVFIVLECGSAFASILVLTAFYMIAAGDITYEASLVPTAIFHSGWELCSTGKNLRSLLVVSMRRSQDEVVMTAFGILPLSYSTFISIIRASYSCFALLY